MIASMTSPSSGNPRRKRGALGSKRHSSGRVAKDRQRAVYSCRADLTIVTSSRFVGQFVWDGTARPVEKKRSEPIGSSRIAQGFSARMIYTMSSRHSQWIKTSFSAWILHLHRRPEERLYQCVVWPRIHSLKCTGCVKPADPARYQDQSSCEALTGCEQIRVEAHTSIQDVYVARSRISSDCGL